MSPKGKSGAVPSVLSESSPSLPKGLATIFFLILGTLPLEAAADYFAPPTQCPAPASYNMGTFVNGDFEASGGSLSGWHGMAGGPGLGGQDLWQVGANHGATLWTRCISMPGPFGDEPMAAAGESELGQTIDIPSNASYISLSYYNEGQVMEYMMLSYPNNSGSYLCCSLPVTGSWATQTLSIPL